MCTCTMAGSRAAERGEAGLDTDGRIFDVTHTLSRVLLDYPAALEKPVSGGDVQGADATYLRSELRARDAHTLGSRLLLTYQPGFVLSITEELHPILYEWLQCHKSEPELIKCMYARATVATVATVMVFDART